MQYSGLVQFQFTANNKNALCEERKWYFDYKEHLKAAIGNEKLIQRTMFDFESSSMQSDELSMQLDITLISKKVESARLNN